MDVLVLIGRILFSAIFIGSGLAGHFGATEGTAAYAESRNVPNARVAVLVSGAWIVIGGLMVILGIWADLGALLLFAYVLVAGVLVHHFWTDEGQQQQGEMTQFMKNLSMAGGALVMFAFIAAAGPDLGLQITEPLFELEL